jgi:opacity protein-like surface antigen
MYTTRVLHSTTIVIAILICRHGIVCAQNEELNPKLSVTTAIGGGFSGLTAWIFHSRGEESVPMKPGVGFEVGLTYGPLVKLAGTNISASASIAYGESNTGKTHIGDSELEGGFQRLPIMVWAAMTTDERLSPFLRGGLGMAKTDYRERSTTGYVRNVRFHEWQFVWGLGGGVRFTTSDSFAIEAFLDAWVSEKDLVEPLDAWYRIRMQGRFAIYLAGIRGTITI